MHHPSAAASFFASALPARGASGRGRGRFNQQPLCLGAACTGCIRPIRPRDCISCDFASALPARGASRGHHVVHLHHLLCLGAACTGCILTAGDLRTGVYCFASALPARGASPSAAITIAATVRFASALPARGASCPVLSGKQPNCLCLGAACTGCIMEATKRHVAEQAFASALPARGASAKADKLRHTIL